MRQLEKIKPIVEEEQKYKREYKGDEPLAISRRNYRLHNSDVLYVESESSNNTYYFVKFKPDVLYWCSCQDNSWEEWNCKHSHSL